MNLDEIGDASHAYESAAFPWCDTERVAFVFDSTFNHVSGQANPATNVFFFTRVPLYAYTETIETIPVTNFNANGSVASVTECPLQIKWVARPEITNGYDRAFYIPPWEKIYARDHDEATDTWTTREIGVKEANYYASYTPYTGAWRETTSTRSSRILGLTAIRRTTAWHSTHAAVWTVTPTTSTRTASLFIP